MGLSLREAAEAAGVSKSSIHRAVTQGRLSATRLDGGAFDIDASELARVFPVKRPGDGPVGRSETAPGTAETRIRLAVLEADLAALKTLLEAERRRGEELRQDRDEWRSQASRLALPKPAAVGPAGSVPSVAPRRSWRDLFRRAG